jgi:hypothetical protein
VIGQLHPKPTRNGYLPLALYESAHYPQCVVLLLVYMIYRVHFHLRQLPHYCGYGFNGAEQCRSEKWTISPGNTPEDGTMACGFRSEPHQRCGCSCGGGDGDSGSIGNEDFSSRPRQPEPHGFCDHGCAKCNCVSPAVQSGESVELRDWRG